MCISAHKQGVPALRVVTDYLVRKCPKRKRAQFRSILQNKKTALLLNERMVGVLPWVAGVTHW
jgi:hypothetical protein